MKFPFEQFRHEAQKLKCLVSLLDPLYVAAREEFTERICSQCLYCKQGICGKAIKVDVKIDPRVESHREVTLRCLNFLEPTRSNKMDFAQYLLAYREGRQF